MRYGRGEFDMPHALAAHFCARDFHAALFADNTLVTDTLIFAAMTFPVLRGSENLFAEQAVAFGLLRAVVDRFGLRHLAVRPFSDFFGRCDADLYTVKIV